VLPGAPRGREAGTAGAGAHVEPDERERAGGDQHGGVRVPGEAFGRTTMLARTSGELDRGGGAAAFGGANVYLEPCGCDPNRGLLETMIDAVGPERVVFGTDMPSKLTVADDEGPSGRRGREGPSEGLLEERRTHLQDRDEKGAAGRSRRDGSGTGGPHGRSPVLLGTVALLRARLEDAEGLEGS